MERIMKLEKNEEVKNAEKSMIGAKRSS